MKYTYNIQGLTNSGKPAIYFRCEHCRQLNFDLTGALYSAQLAHDPRVDIHAAAMEFIHRLNNRDSTVFAKKSTWDKIAAAFCHCDPNVIDIESYKARERAKLILKLGMEEL